MLKSIVYKRLNSVPGFYFMYSYLILCQYLICALDNQLWTEQDINMYYVRLLPLFTKNMTSWYFLLSCYKTYTIITHAYATLLKCVWVFSEEKLDRKRTQLFSQIATNALELVEYENNLTAVFSPALLSEFFVEKMRATVHEQLLWKLSYLLKKPQTLSCIRFAWINVSDSYVSTN